MSARMTALLRATVLPLVFAVAAAPRAGAAPPLAPWTPAAVPTPLGVAGLPSGRPPSNSIIDLEVFGPYLWAATGKGLGRFLPSAGPAYPVAGHWNNIGPQDGFGRGGVSGLAVGTVPSGETILWAATALDTTIDGASFSAGGGVGYSLDLGNTWTWMPQPTDPRDEESFSPTTTNVQNVTFDIELLGSRVWIASWGGGLRYLDMAADEPVWVNQPPDTNSFDVLAHLNHRAFSIAVMPLEDDTLLWVGTAAGVNLSRDNGETWQNFGYSATSEATLSGNFITALAVQRTASGKNILWAASWAAEGTGEYYGITKTEDFGVTWQRVYGSPEEPVRAHNFAFDDSVVYACSDLGLLKSADYGESWGLFPPISDPEAREYAYDPEVFSAAVGWNRLFVGGPEGLGISADGGLTWRLLRTAAGAGPSGAAGAFAYPNPFSPDRHGVVRVQYSLPRDDFVTLEIYDYAMELVIRPVRDGWRPAGIRNEAWNGRGPGGREIANGVYFARLLAGGEEHWAKILLMD